MAKTKLNTQSDTGSASNNAQKNTPAQPANTTAAPKVHPLLDFKIQAIIIAALGFIFYFNSFFNEFALDDRPIIIENEYVKQGIAGIPKILTSDAFESFYTQQNSTNALTGGRYRPFSIVTFAIEQQFLGLPEVVEKKNTAEPQSDKLSDEAQAKIVSDMHVRHIVNVLLYILSVIVLLNFLRKVVFPNNAIIPFIAAILFVIHPLHTEVVANVKSRDEILSLMFICLSFIYAFRYRDESKKTDLYKGLGWFFLALLSKEYGVTFLLLLPASLFLFRKDSLSKAISMTLPFLIPFMVYLLMRYASEAHADGVSVDNIMNVPYLYASASQKIASIIAILFKYFELLVFPHPLSSDYSYHQIPYSDFTSPKFWISLVFYIGLVVAMIKLFMQKHVLSFAIAFYLLHMFLISNILVNIGAPMGERLVYHSSLGFVIAIAFLLHMVAKKMKPETTGYISIGVLLVIVTVFSAYKTIDRNKDWKNDRILYLNDVKTSPNSVMILSNAGSACVDYGDAAKDSSDKKVWYNKGIDYLNKALVIDPKFINAIKNRGVCYYQLGFPDKALTDWKTVQEISPGNPTLPYLFSIASNYYYKEGVTAGKAGRHEEAAVAFAKAASARPNDADVWYNLGFANFSSGKYPAAIKAFEMALRLNSNNPNTRMYYEKAKAMVQ